MFQGTSKRMQRGLQWIWAQEGSPARRARGLAAGVFCGCFPFFGLQMILSVGVATVVRGNPLLAAAGTLVSNPLTYVPLYWFNYLVGQRLLGPGSSDTEVEDISRSTLWAQGWDFTNRIMLGSVVVGAVLALLLGLLSYGLFRRREAMTDAAATRLRFGRCRSHQPWSGSDSSCE